MRIVVCVKVVDGELNPFDECALESALRIKDADVVVVSMCPPSATERLRTLTRLGVNRVILLTDAAFAGSDTLATGYILSVAIKQLKPDYVFCGRQTIDGDTAQVGPMLSVHLGFSLITNVMRIDDLTPQSVLCNTRMGKEHADAPTVLTIERINTLRFPSIRSRLGEVEIITNRELSADITRCGLRGSPTRVLKTYENTSGRRKCTLIPLAALPEIIQNVTVKAETSSVTESTESSAKLPLVYAIGDIVAKKADRIAERVIVLPLSDAESLAKTLKQQNAGVVLWNADLWGRKTAPRVAAMLDTGLCADCTALETDGNRLFMYRPARGGNIIAKIECLTSPQMATVRCEQKSDDIILSCGLGTITVFDRMQTLASLLKAEMTVSRPMVDRNLSEYERQVGLTGKMISPKLYIAVGISGAVQHICAISGAETIIAVNPDKDAPIFDYADYGIIETAENLLGLYQL